MEIIMDFLETVMQEKGQKLLGDLLNKVAIKKYIKEWLDQQWADYKMDALEDIDFEALVNYLVLLLDSDDIDRYTYGRGNETEKARETIISKAYSCSGADDKTSKDKVKRTVESVLDIWDAFMYDQLDEKDKLLLREILKEEKKLTEDRSNPAPHQQTVQKKIGIYKKPRRTAGYIDSDSNRRLFQCAENHKRILVHGMPGIGKTEGVLEYLEQKAYDSVVWMDFETLDQAVRSIGDFFDRFTGGSGMWIEKKSDMLSEMLQQLAGYMEKYENAIIIFDNVNQKEMLKVLSDWEFSCKVIVISCLNSDYGYFENSEVILWRDLDKEESSKLFSKVSGIQSDDADPQIFHEVLKRCAGIPLIIRQAAIYLRESQVSLKEYLELCRQTDTLIIEKISGDGEWLLEKNANACATFWVPYQRIRRSLKITGQCLLFDALLFLSPEGMEKSLLLKITGLSEMQFHDAMRHILKYSLAEKEGEKIRIKSVVQDILRSFLEKPETERVISRIGQVLAEEFLKTTPTADYRETYKELGTNALRFWTVTQNEKMAVKEAAEILQGIGVFYYLQGYYLIGRQYMEQAIEHLNLQENPYLHYRICSELGEMLEAAGDNQLAKEYISLIPLEQNLLQEREPVIVLQGLTVKAHIYENLNQNELALEAAKQVREMVHKEDREKYRAYYLTACISMVNIYNALEKYEDAAAVFEQSVSEFGLSEEDSLEDSLVMALYGSRANTFIRQNCWKEAMESYERQILYCRNQYQNEFHPFLAYMYYNLAYIYVKMSEYENADIWFARAEEIMEYSLPYHHEFLVQILFGHACALYQKEDYGMCSKLIERVLKENTFLADDMRRNIIEANSCFLMGGAKYGLRKWEEAKQFLERSLKNGYTAEEIYSIHEKCIEWVEDGKKIENYLEMTLF